MRTTLIRFLITTVVFLASFNLVPAQIQQKPRLTLYNGDVVTEAERLERIRLIESIVTKFSANGSPYRQFSDGSVCYLGKVLYEVFGLLVPNTNGVNIMLDGFQVHDISDNGCRVTSQKTERDCFITNLQDQYTVYSDRSYSQILMMHKTGDYTYKTVAGGSRTIPKFELGKSITKDQYTAAIKGKK